MSWPLFKMLMKKNWTIWLGFSFILVLYFSVIAAMSDPEMMDLMAGFYQSAHISDGIMPYIGSVFFTSVVFLFPAVFYVMMAHKLVSKAVDNTSISSYLATPISRNKYIITTGLFYLKSIIAQFFVLFLAGCIIIPIFGDFHFVNWLNVVGLTTMATLFVAFVCFFISTALASNKVGMTLLIAIPVVLVTIMMLSSMVGTLEFLRDFTPFGWINTTEISVGMFDLWWLFYIIYLVGSAVLFFLSVIVFRKKQLSI